MARVDARCTQCGSTDFGDDYRTYEDVPSNELKHGTGKTNGTERLTCPTCSGTCSLDECTFGDPCERCATETLHNRCGSSVPTASM